MRFVSVVTSTRSPASVRSRIRDSRSSTCVLAGRTSTCGSTSPVGRTTCSTTAPACCSSYGPGVADTNTACGAIASNSSKRRGRLSSADGSRNPYSTSVSLRERSPRYMPPSCGTVTWLSSMISSASDGM